MTTLTLDSSLKTRGFPFQNRAGISNTFSGRTLRFWGLICEQLERPLRSHIRKVLRRFELTVTQGLKDAKQISAWVRLGAEGHSRRRTGTKAR